MRNRLLEQEARYPLERMREIEQQQERGARARPRRGRASRATALPACRRPCCGDESAATQPLTELVDAGYDGTLVSSQTASGIVLYEIHLGPFETLEEAQRVAGVVQSAHGLRQLGAGRAGAEEEPR